MQCCWAGVGSGPRLTPGEWARDLCVRSRWWLRCCLGDAHRGVHPVAAVLVEFVPSAGVVWNRGKHRKSKSPPKVPIVIQDDSLPTGPPPQIRILKRPTSNGVVSSPNSTSRPALPVKSLAQREAEYAEARKRILGSASPEEEQEKPILDRPTRISQPEDSRQPNNVIRQPLGPDGSQGFKQRR
ncbi:SUZ RNA-binding domain-containing isoform X11 [Oryctolagus cuniculus]|uniref:SUZ RNA-binding domain-containing isoform X11 n=1 Tax=Oryctolagus cuniculus TaxID=9986 RepID=UPI0022309C42|nr:SUZ domain-containing protein 1 isoform X9 [Oryctolagus cuniculus]